MMLIYSFLQDFKVQKEVIDFKLVIVEKVKYFICYHENNVKKLKIYYHKIV